MDSTIKTLFQRDKKRKPPVKRFIYLVFCLLGAMIIAWIPIILFYEIPCKLGEYFDVEAPIVKAALRAERKVDMSHKTGSYGIDKILHELEEMKEFYSRI